MDTKLFSENLNKFFFKILVLQTVQGKIFQLVKNIPTVKYGVTFQPSESCNALKNFLISSYIVVRVDQSVKVSKFGNIRKGAIPEKTFFIFGQWKILLSSCRTAADPELSLWIEAGENTPSKKILGVHYQKKKKIGDIIKKKKKKTNKQILENYLKVKYLKLKTVMITWPAYCWQDQPSYQSYHLQNSILIILI